MSHREDEADFSVEDDEVDDDEKDKVGRGESNFVYVLFPSFFHFDSFKVFKNVLIFYFATFFITYLLIQQYIIGFFPIC